MDVEWMLNLKKKYWCYHQALSVAQSELVPNVGQLLVVNVRVDVDDRRCVEHVVWRLVSSRYGFGPGLSVGWRIPSAVEDIDPYSNPQDMVTVLNTGQTLLACIAVDHWNRKFPTTIVARTRIPESTSIRDR